MKSAVVSSLRDTVAQSSIYRHKLSFMSIDVLQQHSRHYVPLSAKREMINIQPIDL
jgi:hypothetical protein